MSIRNIQHYDVIIARARCAGAAMAQLLARQGARVLLLDKSRYGTDTLSTHALMRSAVVQLHRWGLLSAVAGAGSPPVRSTTFHLADAVTTIPIEPKHGVEALYAPRRRVLDAILADAARGADADVRFGASVTGLRPYQAERDELSLRLFRVTGRMASFDWTTDEIGEYLLQLGEAMAEGTAAMTSGDPGLRLALASA